MSRYREGASIRRGLIERVKLAVGQDSTIITDYTQINETKGVTEGYLVELGLEPADMKRLERAGLALRGYLPTKSGHELRWILIRPREESSDGRTDVPTQGTST